MNQEAFDQLTSGLRIDSHTGDFLINKEEIKELCEEYINQKQEKGYYVKVKLPHKWKRYFIVTDNLYAVEQKLKQLGQETMIVHSYPIEIKR